jgi:hypothetical protein
MPPNTGKQENNHDMNAARVRAVVRAQRGARDNAGPGVIMVKRPAHAPGLQLGGSLRYNEPFPENGFAGNKWKSEKMTNIQDISDADIELKAQSPFADAVEDVRTALRHMGGEFEGDLPELVGQAKEGDFNVMLITPEIVGQFLMETLPIPEMDARLSTAQKLYWMKVAEYMGPDYIRELRRIAAFMDKVDQF